MKKRNWLLLIATVLMVGSLLVGGCGTTTPTASTPAVSTPIKIGALMSQTGFLTDIGKRQKDGIMLALEEAGSKVAGRPVQFLAADDGSIDVPGSVDKTKKMVEADGVSVIFTPLFAGIQDAVFPYLEQMKVPSLSMMGTLWASTKYRYHFSPIGSQAGLAWDEGIYAYELGYRTLTLLAEDSASARVYVLSAAQAFKSKGGQIIQEQYFPMNNIDFGPYLANLKQADAFLFFAPGNGPMRLVQQYRQFGIKMPIMSSGDTIGEENIANLGDVGVGVIDETHYTKNIDTPANKKFVAAYQTKYSRDPAGHDYMGYLNMQLTLAALKATGGDTTPEKLRDAFEKITYDGPAGPVTLGTARWGTNTLYIIQIAKENNQYVYKILKTIPNVKPIDESTIPGVNK